MDELLEDIATEKERIEQTLEALRLTLERNERSFVELAAIATCLHNVYNGMENLLKRILKFLKVPLPDSKTSHQDLVDLAAEKILLRKKWPKLSMSIERFGISLCMAMAFC